jgi:putative iron-only hydrogenase system regulator
MDTSRLGFVGIIVNNRKRANVAVNRVLSEHGEHIVARVGIPYQKRSCCVITLVVDMTTDELGVFTGRLGMLDGVTVKSALAKGGSERV